MVETVYPEYRWKAWQFEGDATSSQYWKERMDKQRNFLDVIGEELGLSKNGDMQDIMNGWYKIKREDIVKKKGGNIYLGYVSTLLGKSSL